MIAVLDASAFAPIIIADERPDLLHGLEEALSSAGMLVPSHWRVEVANLLLVAARHGRITNASRKSAIQTIDSVVLEVDMLTTERLFDASWALAERHRLSIYDAAYLELAIRRELPIASLDRKLLSAAKSESVPVFGR